MRASRCCHEIDGKESYLRVGTRGSKFALRAGKFLYWGSIAGMFIPVLIIHSTNVTEWDVHPKVMRRGAGIVGQYSEQDYLSRYKNLLCSLLNYNALNQVCLLYVEGITCRETVAILSFMLAGWWRRLDKESTWYSRDDLFGPTCLNSQNASQILTQCPLFWFPLLFRWTIFVSYLYRNPCTSISLYVARGLWSNLFLFLTQLSS